jgi:hypothetical protein
VNRRDYEKLAECVVGNLSDGVPMEDSILEIAGNHSLNPEQIRRLVELSNTGAFLKLFGDTKGDDRMVDFDVADPRSVLKKFMAAAPEGKMKSITISISQGPDEDFFTDVKDELRVDEDAHEGPRKEASAPDSPLTRKLGHFERLRVIDSLNDKLASAFYAIDDLAADVGGRFSGMYSRGKLAAFEADILATQGESALPALLAVRSKVGSNDESFEDAKLAARNRIVSESNNAFNKIASCTTAIQEYQAVAKALAYLDSGGDL